MIHFRKLLMISSLFAILSCGSDDDGSAAQTGGSDDGNFTASANYQLTFDTNFTDQTHPIDYPSNASFGPIVAIIHSPDISVYQLGQLASDGLKAYAEDGDVGTLANFLTSEAGEAGENLFAITSVTASGPTSQTTINVTATPSRTRITFLAKINPSPDWFLAVNSFDIIDGNSLIDEAMFNLGPIDAGTDAGMTYEAPNEQDSQVISNYEGSPFGDGPFFPALATLTIERDN